MVDNTVDPAEEQRQKQKFITQKGREPSLDGVNDNGTTDMHFAAELNLHVLIKSLLDRGAKVNSKDKYDYTPLHIAARHNAAETAEVLLDRGAKVNSKDKYDYTPLHIAARHNAAETAEVLLDRGAKVNAKAKILILLSPIIGALGLNGTPLRIAEKHGATKTAELLRRYGGRNEIV